jgi:hypothetical protein
MGSFTGIFTINCPPNRYQHIWVPPYWHTAYAYYFDYLPEVVYILRYLYLHTLPRYITQISFTFISHFVLPTFTAYITCLHSITSYIQHVYLYRLLITILTSTLIKACHNKGLHRLTNNITFTHWSTNNHHIYL